MARLFGTDGVRGIANEELTCDLTYRLGKAGAYVLTKSTHHSPTLIIGKDTRISGDMLEAALISGICAMGANVIRLGVVPTPAVAYLVRELNADAGVMISASHNPMEHNGIKFFNSNGYKLSDELEDEIEALLYDDETLKPKTGAEIGRVKMNHKAVDTYVDFVASTISCDLSDVKCLVDCANGSASTTAAKLFAKLGAKAEIINNEPNGVNINDHCGSTHMEMLSELVKKGDYQCGIAFDGDADRCLVVDENGNLVDGDKMIACCACNLKRKGKLKNNAAVVTVMTNMGFHEMAKEHGIDVVASKVGDRYVLEEMQKGDFIIGGEQSGHIIFLEHNTTGDGQITALQFLCTLKEEGMTASQANAIMKEFPQIHKNIHVTKEVKETYQHDPAIQDAIHKAEEALGSDGRVLVRASGTESLIRVMVEGKDGDLIQKLADELAELIASK